MAHSRKNKLKCPNCKLLWNKLYHTSPKDIGLCWWCNNKRKRGELKEYGNSFSN